MSVSFTFRIEAGKIGGGHYQRCKNLQDQLRVQGVNDFTWAIDAEAKASLDAQLANEKVVVLSKSQQSEQVSEIQAQGGLSASVLLTDGYNLTDETHRTAREKGFDGLIVANDERLLYEPTARKLEPNQLFSFLPQHAQDFHRLGRVPQSCEVYAGPQYTLTTPLSPTLKTLREDWLKAGGLALKPSIMLTNGNFDLGGMTAWALKAISSEPDLRDRVVVRAFTRAKDETLDNIKRAALQATQAGLETEIHVNDPNFQEYLATSYMVVGAAGMTPYECAALGGIPSILMPAGHNQLEIADAARQIGAAIDGGTYLVRKPDRDIIQGLVPTRMLDGIKALIDDKTLYARMTEASRQFCDGKGTEREAAIILKTLAKPLVPVVS